MNGEKKVHTRIKRELAMLNPDSIKKVIVDCSPGKPYYDLFGGEPLMYPWLGDIIETIKFYGSEVDLPTNGTLLEQQAEMLVEASPNKIWISIDGPEEINDSQRGEGTYQKAVAGINKLYELRKSKSKKYPKIGVSYIITALNFKYIEDFFLHHIDLSILDQISIEVQLFATEQQCKEYEFILQNEFDINYAEYARGMVWDSTEFNRIDVPEVIRQLKSVEAQCKKTNTGLITYPRTIQEENFRNYFLGRFQNMIDKKSRCSLPWIYTEINANGDVSPCHAFYDLTFGNINDTSIPYIWNSSKYKKYRNYMKRNLLPICTACSRYYAYNSKGDGIF